MLPARRAVTQYREVSGSIRLSDLTPLWDMVEEYEGPLSGVWSRHVTAYGPRLALALSGRDEIAREHTQRAAVLVRWFFTQMERALNMIHYDRGERVRQKILEALPEDKAPLSRAELMRAVRISSKEMDLQLDTLVEREEITIEKENTDGRAKEIIIRR